MIVSRPLDSPAGWRMKRVNRAELHQSEREVWGIVSTGSLAAVRRGDTHDVLLLRTFVPTSGWVDWFDFAGADFDAIYERVASRDGRTGERLRTSRGEDPTTIYIVPIEVYTGAEPQERIEAWVRSASDEFLIGPILFRIECLPPTCPGGYPIEVLRFKP